MPRGLQQKKEEYIIYVTSECKRVDAISCMFWDKVCTQLRVQTWKECVDICIVVRMCSSARSSLQLSFARVNARIIHL